MPTYRKTLPMIAASIMITFATALTGCSGETAGPGSSPSVSSSHSAEAKATHNASDVMFVQMMTPHHQQAVEMSDLLLSKNNVDPRVRKLATQIRAAQAPEIEQMAGWAKSWDVSPTPPAGHDHGGDMGMMDESELADLRKADGEPATTLFLSGMIKHHEGAITMAEEEKAKGSDPAALRLAGDIIATQQAEIDTMKSLQQDL